MKTIIRYILNCSIENQYYFDANIKSKIRYLGPYLVILYLSQTELKFSSCHSVQ